MPRRAYAGALLVRCLLLVQCVGGGDLVEAAPDAADSKDSANTLTDSAAGDSVVGPVDSVLPLDQLSPDLSDASLHLADSGVDVSDVVEIAPDHFEALDSGPDQADVVDAFVEIVDTLDWSDGLVETIDAADICTPDCAGIECGDDGCGGSCGECPPIPCFELCVEGVCEASVIEPEECDGLDNDCDGDTDEGFDDYDSDSIADCVDLDDDGDGDPDATDCEPLDEYIYNWAEEMCDCLDNNCNGVKDEGYPDLDGDGCCDVGGDDDNDGDPDDTDCAPQDPLIFHFAIEECDGVDNNCNGVVDDENAVGCKVYYLDSDEDLWGVEEDKKCLCLPVEPYTSSNTGDCNDDDPSVNPGAPEMCNLMDEDCDGEIDEDADWDCDDELSSTKDVCLNGQCSNEPFAVCGNGVMEPGEECDDGNLLAGDGCSESCEVECQAPQEYQSVALVDLVDTPQDFSGDKVAVTGLGGFQVGACTDEDCGNMCCHQCNVGPSLEEGQKYIAVSAGAVAPVACYGDECEPGCEPFELGEPYLVWGEFSDSNWSLSAEIHPGRKLEPTGPGFGSG